jgi:two-component system OmpR family sensor kinase/two-component system sensor histidine kinase BaeS
MSQTETVRSIRNRLFTLLLRAFATVVVITLVIVLVSTLLTLTYQTQKPERTQGPILDRLETYFLTHGNWEGVASIQRELSRFELFQWKNSILLDSKENIIIEKGVQVETITPYIIAVEDTVIPLVVNDETVGGLVIIPGILSSRWLIAASGLVPVFIVSFFLAILTTLIGLFLTRRVVAPLAEVIAAAQEVTNGNFETRVHVKGPDDLRVLIDSFNQMATTLQRNEQERRDMLADVAHELRTPLTVLRGRLEGILDGIYEANDKNLSTALASTYLLEHLVEDLQLLALAESRQLQFNKKDIDLIVLTTRSLQMFAAQAQEKQISLSLDHNTAETNIMLDPQRTEQIIGNLLNNALQFAPIGGKVWINIQADPEKLMISVNDNGAGVASADMPFIFNRFWRKEKSRSRLFGGSGLGLAITKHLVEAQGGTVYAERNETNGLSVKILFFPNT